MRYTIFSSSKIDELTGTFINSANTSIEVNKIISDYISSINFKSYYWRTLIFEDELTYVIDYGSYSNFVVVSCDSKESFKSYLNNK